MSEARYEEGGLSGRRQRRQRHVAADLRIGSCNSYTKPNCRAMAHCAQHQEVLHSACDVCNTRIAPHQITSHSIPNHTPHYITHHPCAMSLHTTPHCIPCTASHSKLHTMHHATCTTPVHTICHTTCHAHPTPHTKHTTLPARQSVRLTATPAVTALSSRESQITRAW